MNSTETSLDAPVARPKSLSASSLLQRAAIGLLILITGIALSAWLYDAGIKANAADQPAQTRAAD